MTACGTSLLLLSCETYKYMRDPDAPKRAEALERSALIAETEANIPPEEYSADGLPNSSPAAFYDDFPEGTNPTETTLFPTEQSIENNNSDGEGEFERWVHGPDGILVPASSLNKDASEPVTEEDTASESPGSQLPE